MIGTSPLEYAWVVSWAIILNSVGPLCTIYTMVAIFLPESLRVWTYLEYWTYLETIFYFISYAYRERYLQRPALHPRLLGKDDRDQLFHLCFDNSPDLAASISKWFLGAPISSIKRENMKEWFRWAFFNTDLEDPILDDEVETYVKQFETKLGMKFESGRSDVRSIRLTLDKVNALHRSMTWYMCIFVVDMLTHTYLRFHGFHFYPASVAHSVSVIPPRPQALVVTHRSTGNNTSYWYQAHTSRDELPMVFFHGIGVGLYPYMQLLKEVNQGRRLGDGRIGILAVEILAISSRLTTPVLCKEEMCQQLRAILNRHGIGKFVLLSHSYGSVITTYLLKTPDMASQISSVILVDPISILLHEPDVVYNFTVRKPRRANEWLLWFFGSKDIGVAHTLARTFFWSQKILWKEDLLKHDATVFLCGIDSIINAPKVRRYLEEGGSIQNSEVFTVKDLDNTVELQHQHDHDSLKVVWCADLDHGQVFDLAIWRDRLKTEILKKARRGV